MAKLTRDEVRAAFARSGLSYDELDDASLKSLRQHLDRKMKDSGLIKGTFRMRKSGRWKTYAGRLGAELRCKSFYFDDREAVTFNPDGFVGFGGWADEVNIQPILTGFMSWLSLVTDAGRAALAGEGDFAQPKEEQGPKNDGR
jgi:hypothetical protein